MENTKAMSIQMPEETYQRMQSYLKQHGMKQKEFIDMVLRRALDKEAGYVAPDEDRR